MLRGVILSPDEEMRRMLEARIAETDAVLLLRAFDRYLTPEELVRFQRTNSPQVVFMDVATNEEMLGLAARLPKLLPGVAVVALHRECEPGLLMRLMQGGIREFLCAPFERGLLTECVARVGVALREAPVIKEATDDVYAFLPAKPGAGASTIATNTAVAMSRALESKVLLADFDINSGIARFLLKLTNGFSVLDALDKAAEMDDQIWAEVTSNLGGLDVLASGPIAQGFPGKPGATRRLLDFARRRYKAICLDFSGALEEFSLETLQECRRIMLVTQPDLPTVYLAREKVRFLRALNLEDAVCLIVNRWHREACLSIADIESVVGLPVHYTFGEDGGSVYRAMLSGIPVDAATEFGKDLARLALTLCEPRPERTEVTPKRRMVEYFSLLPARYSLLR